MSLVAASRSELTKQFTTSLWWVLALILVLYVGFATALLGLTFAGVSTGRLPGSSGPPIPIDGLAALVYSTATSVGYVFPLLIGTLMVTAEFRHKTLTATFLAVPRRGLVLGAKFAVGILLGLLYGAIGIAAAVGAGAGSLAAFGVDTALGSADTWALVARMLLAYVLWVLVGIGVGTAVRNQVAAIVIVLAVTLFVEPIARTVAGFVDGIDEVTRWLPSAASDALVGQTIFTAMSATGGEQPVWWVGGLVLLGYAVVLLLVGQLSTWRRDVN